MGAVSQLLLSPLVMVGAAGARGLETFTFFFFFSLVQ